MGSSPSLAEFAAVARSGEGVSQRWFRERPELAEEVLRELRRGCPVNRAFRWVKAYHGFPHAPATFAIWAEEALKDADA